MSTAGANEGTQVIRMAGAASGDDGLERAAEVLARGGIVALPTETVYGLAVSADHPGAVERLRDLKGRPADKPFAHLVGSRNDLAALGLVEPGRLATKLLDRYWPGPLTLVLPRADGEGHTAVRLPSDSIAREVVSHATGPVFATSANRSGEPEALDAQGVLDQFEGRIDLLIDGGRAPLGRASSIVRIDVDEGGNERLEVLREGAIPGDAIRRLACRTVLFVCGGNTCRSPMAAAIATSRIARSLGIDPDDLEGHRLRVTSAGTGAMEGAPASDQAIQVARQEGLDLSRHRASALRIDTCLEADHILVMTLDQARKITEWVPAVQYRIRLLDPAGTDIQDPFGMSLATYSKVFFRIGECVDEALIRYGYRKA